MEKFKANDTLETIKQSVLSNGTEVDGMTELKFSYTSRIRYYYENYVIRESAPDFLREAGTSCSYRASAESQTFCVSLSVREKPCRT